MNFNFETTDPTLVLIIITKTLDTALHKVCSHLYTKFPRSKNKKSHIQISVPRNSLDQKTKFLISLQYLYLSSAQHMQSYKCSYNSLNFKIP